MKRVTFLLALFLLLNFLSPSVFAQKSEEDVVVLKKGWILRGKIIPSAQPDQITIITGDKNQFVFGQAEVSEVKKEPLKYSNYMFTRYRDHGFVHYTEMGALAARNTDNDNVNTSAFSFQTVNGYKFNQFIAASGGIGVDLYATQTFLPLFLDLRGDFIKKGNLIPFYFIDLGYGVNVTRNENVNRTFYGGTLFAGGLGVRLLFFNTSGFVLSLGYRQQKSAIENVSGGLAEKNELNYQRVAIRAGFTF